MGEASVRIGVVVQSNANNPMHMFLIISNFFSFLVFWTRLKRHRDKMTTLRQFESVEQGI